MRLIRGRRELLSGIVPQYTDPEACTRQLLELQKQVPSLYALLSVNACALAYTHYALAPAWLTVGLPGLMIALCAMRAVHWWRLRPEDIPWAAALRRLRSTSSITPPTRSSARSSRCRTTSPGWTTATPSSTSP